MLGHCATLTYLRSCTHARLVFSLSCCASLGDKFQSFLESFPANKVPTTPLLLRS